MLYNLRLRFLPLGTKRYQIVRSFYFFIKDLFLLGFLRRFLNKLVRQMGPFDDGYIPEDLGDTVLYTNQDGLFPNYPFRQTLSAPRTRVKVTLISTLKDEASNVQQWMERIYQQTRLPDEIVLVDGGSTDGTVEMLRSMVAQSPVPLHILQEPGVNIARGRNAAIGHAEHEIIAAIDFGCRPEPEWLENILAPFELDEKIQMVSGWYEAVDHQGNIVDRRSWPRLDQIQPDTFIPSSRSIAFTKEVWQKAQGYPAWLTLTGEDTYFALELRRFCSRRAFVPDAIVQWFAPETIKSYLKKVFYWSVGDGEFGWNGNMYFRTARRLVAAGIFALLMLLLVVFLAITRSITGLAAVSLFLLMMLAGIWLTTRKTNSSILMFMVEIGAKVQQVRGYLSGAKRRSEVDKRRFAGTKGVFVILAGVPLEDTGGGSRGAQIALELLRQNFLVVYIHKFNSNESVDLGHRLLHPNLLAYQLSNFSWPQFHAKYGEFLVTKECRVLIEFPLKDFIPLIEHFRSLKAVIGYDLLDDWDTQLGSTWYDKRIEKQVIDLSDVLIATAPVLADRLTKLSNRPVALLPNAVNLRLFRTERAYQKPEDLPEGSFVITYIGALWGEWFDWELLVEVAKTYSEAAIMVIGDYREQCPEKLPNLHFLGLKPQSSLPAYLQYSDITIIPWKKNDITFATSPLKLYEYLAMNVPVVVPDLPPLYGIPFVYVSEDEKAFLQNIEAAIRTPVLETQIQNYIRQHSWEYRIEQMTRLLVNQSNHTKQT